MKKIILLAVLCLMPFLLQPAFGLTKKNSIVSNLGLYGGQPEVIGIDYGSDNIYVANYAPNGLFYTDDGGTTWNGLPSAANLGVAKSVAVDQVTEYVYALVGDSLLRSTDNGVNFFDISNNVGFLNFAFDRALLAEPGRLMVAMSDGSVIISTDNGVTFNSSVIATGQVISHLAASPTAGVYYAVLEDDSSGSDALYETIDGGINWTNMDVYNFGVTAGDNFYRAGVDPLDANHIVLTSIINGQPNYQTFDGGLSWQELTFNGQGLTSGYVEFDGQGRMFTSSYYTEDASANPIVWNTMTGITALSSLYFDQLVIDRDNPEIIISNTGLGVAKSIDRGQTWTDIVDGITSVKSYAISQANNKDIVWVGNNGGLARSTNFTSNNLSWTYPILPDQSIANWKGLWVHPSNPDIVVAAGGTSIFRTESGQDASPTWTQSNVPAFAGGTIQDIVVSPNSNDILYAVLYNDDLSGPDSGAVLKTIDQGITWTSLSIPNNVSAYCITVAKNGALFVGLNGDSGTLGVYKFSVGGVWSKPSADLDSFEITSILADPADVNTLYATTNNGFYKSKDKGVNWKKITKGLKNADNLATLAIQTSTTPNTLYLSGQKSDLNAGIYKSQDAGKTWNLLFTGLKQEAYYDLHFDGLITGNDRGLYEIKSRPSLKLKVNKRKIKKNKKVKLTMTLKDKATDKKLKKKRVKVYKKVGKKKWKVLKTAKTNKNGKLILQTLIKKNTRFKAKWNPKKNAAEEYANVISKVVRVRLK